MPNANPAVRRPQSLRTVLAVIATAAGLAAALPAAAQELVVRSVQAASYQDVHDALIDAVAEQGIAPPSESDFGDLLARTAADLGHRPDLYAEARLVSFCSTPIAARLAAESVHNMLYCPLAIAVYRLPAERDRVYLSYRRNADSAGGKAAEALLERIVERAAAPFQPGSRKAVH